MDGYNILILLLVLTFDGYGCKSKINDFILPWAFLKTEMKCVPWKVPNDTDTEMKCMPWKNPNDTDTEMKCMPWKNPNDTDIQSLHEIPVPNKGKSTLVLVTASVSMILLVCCVLVYIRIRRRRILISKHDYGHEVIDQPTDLVQTNMKEPDPSTDSANLTDNQTPETTRGLPESKETTGKQRTTTKIRSPEGETNSKVLDDDQERVMCKICLSRKMNVVFSPCNHMVACASCSDLLDRCAVCRTPIKGTFVVYTEF